MIPFEPIMELLEREYLRMSARKFQDHLDISRRANRTMWHALGVMNCYGSKGDVYRTAQAFLDVETLTVAKGSHPSDKAEISICVTPGGVLSSTRVWTPTGGYSRPTSPQAGVFNTRDEAIEEGLQEITQYLNRMKEKAAPWIKQVKEFRKIIFPAVEQTKLTL